MKTQIAISAKGGKIKLILICYILIAIGGGFLLLFANDLLALIFNDYLMVQNFDGFIPRLLLMAGLFALVYAKNILDSFLLTNYEYSTISRLTRHYIAVLLRAKISFFTNRPTAELYSNLWTVSQVTGRFFSQMIRMISGIVIFVFYGIVVFRFDLWAGIFSIVALPVYFLLTVGLGNKVSDQQHAYVATVADLATATQESLENVANVKAKGAYDFFIGRSAAVLRKIKKIVVKVTVIESYISNITGLVRMIAPLLIIFVSMGISGNFEASAGNVMVLFINIPLFLGGLSNIHRGYIEYKMAKPFLAKLQEFDEAIPEDESGIDIAGFESLETAGVRVSFEGGATISVPDFKISKSEKIMFFGESGIGKSTVFNIILGFLEYEGDVLINGIDLRKISLASLRRIFGITFQHTNALTLDLRENILLGTDKSDKELANLIKLAALEGQQESKGEAILNNKILSGGEKSRLGLSQMLAANPEIMLIDEAFSNMDEELEAKILREIFNEYPERAIICVSHRNSSKPYFDRIVDFNK